MLFFSILLESDPCRLISLLLMHILFLTLCLKIPSSKTVYTLIRLRVFDQIPAMFDLMQSLDLNNIILILHLLIHSTYDMTHDDPVTS